VIVVDRFFDSSKCAVDNKERADTRKLKDTLSALEVRVPIVSGVDVSPSKSVRHGPNPGISGDDALPFALGIINLDFDNRRLPLRWATLDQKKDVDILTETNNGLSLALEAAGQYDPRILEKNRRLKRMVDRGENPYISFLKEDQFTQFYAGEILCLVPNEEIERSDCDKVPRHDPKADRPTLRDLNHQIVIIGERTDREDNHNSAIGEVPGFYLQANYIEALLDDRVFRPAHPLVNYALGFLIFAIFEHILIKHSKKLVSAIAWIAVLLAATLIVLYFVVVQFGYYLNPVTVGLLAIAIGVGHLVLERAEGHEEQPRQDHEERQGQGS
jgi:hypothetical protein